MTSLNDEELISTYIEGGAALDGLRAVAAAVRKATVEEIATWTESEGGNPFPSGREIREYALTPSDMQE